MASSCGEFTDPCQSDQIMNLSITPPHENKKMSPRLHGGHHFIHYVPADMSIITTLRMVTGRRETLFSLGLQRCSCNSTTSARASPFHFHRTICYMRYHADESFTRALALRHAFMRTCIPPLNEEAASFTTALAEQPLTEATHLPLPSSCFFARTSSVNFTREARMYPRGPSSVGLSSSSRRFTYGLACRDQQWATDEQTSPQDGHPPKSPMMGSSGP